jgi:two-component system, chemotaxis family, CheB/CheR fusion protein
LIPTDVGRPISDLSHRLEDYFIVNDAQRVLERLIPFERERRSRDGRWYIARFLPYRTPEDLISGVVLTFVDITERKKAEGEHARLHAAVAGAQEHLRLIFENVREYAIFSVDRERRVISWNIGAERLLGLTESAILGSPYDVIFTAEDRATGVPANEVAQALAQGHASNERWYQRKDGARLWGSGVIMAIRGTTGEAVGLVKILRDETESRRASEALVKALRETKAARAEAEAANSAKDRFTVTSDGLYQGATFTVELPIASDRQVSGELTGMETD